MVPTKGLHTDTNEINQPQGTWRDAWNILSNKFRNAISIEDGFEVTATNYPASAIPIGVAVFPDNSYVVFSDGTTDRIGYVDINDNYTDIIVDNILGFNYLYPILAAEIDYNYLGEKIVSWTDANQVPRILNLDTIPFSLNGSKGLVNPADINDLNLFPEFKVPDLSFSVNQLGGSVKSGTYHISVAYENIDGTRTPASIPFKTIYITDDNSSNSFNSIDGVAGGSATGKSINLSFSNIDTRYDKLVLIIVARNNSLITFTEVKTIDIGGTTLNTTYVGTETGVTLSEDEVLTKRPIYIKSRAMTRLNDRLYHGNLESQEEIDFQSRANAIVINYTSTLTNVLNISQSHKNNYVTGFPHGEVVAFYIGFHLNNGSLSRLFHIPGRPQAFGESVTGTSAVGTGIGISGKVYQIEDTTNRLGATSNMGYWENENELYPANFPSLAGQKVKHHVFPTISKCKTQHYSGNAEYGITQLDVLGINVSNVNIPSDIASKITGWSIFYAKRNESNSINLGTDITQLAAYVEGNTNIIWTSGGNWHVDAQQAGSDGWKDLFIHFGYLRSHNLDLLKNKPSIAPTFADFELKLVKSSLNSKYSSVGKQGGYFSTSGSGKGQHCAAVVDFTDSINTVASSLPKTIRQITEYKYLANNIKDGNTYNIKGEEVLLLKINNFPVYTVDKIRTNSPNQSPDANLFETGKEETYLYSLKQLKTDVYVNYNDQIPVMTDKIAVGAVTSLSNIYGGDVFLNYRSFINSAPQHGEDYGQDEYFGISVIKAHVSENKTNHGLRYEETGNPATKYYPKTSPSEFFLDPDTNTSRSLYKMSASKNELGYNEDYSQHNDLIATTIYSPSDRFTNKFPYRVIRSGSAGTNPTSLNSWKTYLATDFYEGNRNRGPIINLASLNDILLIHHKHGLFRTLSNEQLNVGVTEVYLGTGDIFAKSPKELITSKNGYLGTQNIFSCFTFPNGYGWVDQSSGRVFIFSANGVSEISKLGNYNYFRDNLLIDNTYPDNPIAGYGITAGYDPKYNRIIISKKSDNSLTASFSIDDNMWICKHTYVPDYLFFTNKTILSFNSNKIYKHNIESKKAIYYSDTPAQSSITLIFNGGNDIDKWFTNLNWITEAFNQGILKKNVTFNKLYITTSYQDTQEITLVPFTSFGVPHNVRRERTTWNFNKLRDYNTDVYKKKELIDKYLKIKYTFDNAKELDNSQNSLYLYNFGAKYALPK